MIHLAQFIIQLVLLYYVSRSVIQNIYLFFKRIIRNDSLIYRLVAVIYFPGTVFHEMAHMLAAMTLMLNVREIHFLPKIRGTQIRLGHVIYEKKDIVRGVLVGIAPIIAGLCIFWFFAVFHLFPATNIAMSILVGYVIFVISSTMFSSKQDLVDLLYILPLIMVALILGIYFKIDISQIFNNQTMRLAAVSILENINLYLLFSLLINSGIMVSIRVFLYLSKK